MDDESADTAAEPVMSALDALATFDVPDAEEEGAGDPDISISVTEDALGALDALDAPAEDADGEDDGPDDDDDGLLDAAADSLLDVEAGDAADEEDVAEEEAVDIAPVEEAAAAEHAGGRIRPVEEVDNVRGDKLVGTLHEEETSTLTPDGEIVEQTVTGLLTVQNPSDKDRLWDIDIFLNGLEHTDLDDSHLPVQELESGDEHTSAYSVSGPRMLVLRERFDTKPDRGQERSLSAVCSPDAEPISLEIEVENVGPVDLTEVVVHRKIPSQIHVEDSDQYELSQGDLTWSVGTLTSGGKRTLPISATLTSEVVETIDGGEARAEYVADATLSGMNFAELDAWCRGFSYMTIDEDERPDNWQCQVVFENRSSFAVDLVKLRVKQVGSDDLLFDISDVDEDVAPDGRWESSVELVQSTVKPNFNQELGFTVLPRVTSQTLGKLALEPCNIAVLEAGISKSYSTEVLRSYREAAVDAEVSLTNSGSATINLMRLTDDVPGVFNSPDADQVTCSIEGKEMLREQFRIEVKEGISLEEKHVSPDGPGHTMIITVGTKGPIGLEPGQTLTVNYSLVAPDPTPDNDVVAGPARVDFSAERFGPVATRGVEDVPAIRVIHKRRRFSTGKEVFAAGGAGRYEVLIMFQNRSDSALRDLIIHDLVPPSFDIKGFSIRSDTSGNREAEMVKEEGDDGTKVSWHLDIIEKDERIEVIYELVGDDDSEYKVSATQESHGATFGDEVDEDLPPLPEPEPEEEEAEEPEESDEEEADDSDGDADDSEADEDDAEGDADDSDADEDDAEGDSDDSEADEDDADGDADDSEGDEDDAEMDAALAKLTGGGETEEESADEEASEDEAAEDGDSRVCPVCDSSNPAGANVCSACSFKFPDE
jgi:hypothetical protein